MKKIIIPFVFLLASFVLLFIGFFLGQQNQPKVLTSLRTPTSTLTLTPIPTTSRELELYKVVKVIDGDTLVVDIKGKKETVRLIGIDSPELADPRKPVQCFAQEASQKAKQVLTGKKVSLEKEITQGEKDKYQRLLRYVFLEDGTNFNKFMISEGFAHEYTYQIPYKYQKDFKDAERQAQENKKGLWADDACVSRALRKLV